MAQAAKKTGLSFTSRKRIRKNFGRIETITSMPNLIEVQKNSYDQFLQINIPSGDRTKTGMQGVFASVFPIKDIAETSTLEYVKFTFDQPKYDVDEC
ncbi:MAG: DNA-directed RNA polymerase subunit beta, partial [Alphaproteobacteria bacterium]